MKKILFTLLCSFILISCGTTSFVDRAKKLELGMTKREVISVMGNDFRVISASKTPEGDLEILRYVATVSYTDYVIYLLDGKLVEWHEENPNEHPGRPPHPPKPHHGKSPR